ncbi:hypothetical protein CHS0354_030089 [Potamilus streckersoni]|uniref:RND efflux pump membrane fusion protein barrel-sandwich domain-containing protein n=1 Tax=Potamilus streckersoni TaxID=2493646 RepID=A0AAE0RLL7_9BIVA|nr:hypothetical protein CHS0354_030089 [Potamilus streckersoni]
MMKSASRHIIWGLFLILLNYPLINQPLSAQTVNVKTQKVSSQAVDRKLSYTGTIKSYRAVALVAEKEGLIESISAAEGKNYNPGDVLIVIDTASAKIAAEQAKFSMDAALNDVYQQETGLQNAVTSYRFDLYNLEISRKDYENEKKLYAQQMSSKTVLETTEKKYRSDLLKAEASGAALTDINIDKYKPYIKANAEKQLKQGTKTENLKMNFRTGYIPLDRAIINFEIARNNYKKALLDLSDAYIKAPFKGTVLKKYDPEEGKFVKRGEVVIDYGNVSKITVETAISQDDISLIKIGSSAEITVDATPGKTYTGKVESIAQSADTANRSFTVRISTDNPQGILKPGYAARVKFEIKLQERTITAPTYSVILSSAGSHVFVVKNNIAHKIEVKTGKNIGQNTIIASGLREGDQLVIRGQAFLKDGDTVSVAPN